MDEEKSKIVKTAYRWIIVNDHLPSWVFTSIERPVIDRGKSTGEAYFTLVDPVCDCINLPQVLIDLCLPNVKEARKALGEFKLQGLDDQDKIIDEWIYRDAYISFVDFGRFDYNKKDAAGIVCTLTYKNAEYISYCQKTN